MDSAHRSSQWTEGRPKTMENLRSKKLCEAGGLFPALRGGFQRFHGVRQAHRAAPCTQSAANVARPCRQPSSVGPASSRCREDSDGAYDCDELSWDRKKLSIEAKGEQGEGGEEEEEAP